VKKNITGKGERYVFSSGFAYGDYKNKDRSSFRGLTFPYPKAPLKVPRHIERRFEACGPFSGEL
jgi:hypothetical protein